eukprot:7067400-Pyramimonas_sp.AAC.1
MGGGDACELRLWRFRWSSLRGHETHWARETHANTPIEAFGGASHGATKRCPGRGDACEHPHWGL